jgi:predicted DNA-binding transcriptional regulator YafY
MIDILAADIEDETVITFYYSDSRGVESFRTFSPWEIQDGGLNIIGWDHSRDAVRKFSISGIFGTINHADEKYIRPAT